MPYKISGSTNENSRIIVIKQSDWTVETTQSGVVGSFELTGLLTGNKTVLARNTLGKLIGVGSISPEEEPGGDRGIFNLAYNGSGINNGIEYVTITSLGDAQSFGEMSGRSSVAGCSNGPNDRGLFIGGYDGSIRLNVIEYITISSLGNPQDFGDITVARNSSTSSSNHTDDRAVNVAGNYASHAATNVMDYMTISSPGNASDFGDSLIAAYSQGAGSNGVNDRMVMGGFRTAPGGVEYNSIHYLTITSLGNCIDLSDMTMVKFFPVVVTNLINDRAVFGGGYNASSNSINVIDYITISTSTNASDFGDLPTATGNKTGGCSNGTDERGLFAGGNTGSGYINVIDYITIDSASNAADFGDLSSISGAGLQGFSNA